MTRCEPAVRVERHASDERILTLTLNRPEVLNAYDRTMRDALWEGLELAVSDASVHVVVLRGAGRAFSSGGDLTEFGTAPSPIRAREIRAVRDVWARFVALPCISLAAVHGVAAGGGLEMALLCDLIVCARNARLGLPETGLGAIPGVGGTQTLPRAAGEGRAAHLLLTGEWIDGAAAARFGIASLAVPPERFERAVDRLAGRVARLPSPVLRGLKQAIRRGRDLRLAEALSLEKRLARTLGGSPQMNPHERRR
ncbi:MAG: enoyl-CoA hydratase/isomerase family protein [Deltaproteobacteria bacterium]|nr:enoyl-CoA hydratase/isomerase family protein [Deltaproteobacteria bacterium]